MVEAVLVGSVTLVTAASIPTVGGGGGLVTTVVVPVDVTPNCCRLLALVRNVVSLVSR